MTVLFSFMKLNVLKYQVRVSYTVENNITFRCLAQSCYIKGVE